MLCKQSSAVRLSVCLWASETAARFARTHTHTDTQSRCAVRLHCRVNDRPSEQMYCLHTIKIIHWPSHQLCSFTNTTVCVCVCTHLHSFYMRNKELTAKAQHVVVHFISVTFKQLRSHIHHAFKRFHLSKRKTRALELEYGRRSERVHEYDYV